MSKYCKQCRVEDSSFFQRSKKIHIPAMVISVIYTCFIDSNINVYCMQWWKATVKRCSVTELVGPVVELVYDALPEHGFESQEVCRARFVSKCVLEHVEDGIQGEMVWRCEGDDDDGDEHAPALDVIRHTLSREIENHPSHVQRVLADKVTMAIDAFRYVSGIMSDCCMNALILLL